jgi:hypothetical protein
MTVTFSQYQMTRLSMDTSLQKCSGYNREILCIIADLLIFLIDLDFNVDALID